MLTLVIYHFMKCFDNKTRCVEMHIRIYVTAVIAAALVGHVGAQCTFHSTFASTSWHDNTKGVLTFGASTMTGWGFETVRPGGATPVSPTWQCVNSSGDSYLVMRTQAQISVMTGSGSTNVYAYLCMELTKITDVSYRYYQKQVQQLNLGGERLKLSGSETLTHVEVCDNGVTVPTPEFHVLVKSGSESQAAVQCPDALLFTGDYTYHGSDGTTSCDASRDTWDTCSDKTQMTFNYNTCSQQVLFSAGGQLSCIVSVYSGLVYTVVYNQDATITSGLTQFACLAVEGSYVSVAPGNCTATQTPYSFPKEADGTTSLGHRLVVTEKYVDCGPDSGLEDWEIALIVLSVLYVMFITTLIAVFAIIFIYVAMVFLIVMLHLTGLTDFKQGTKLDLPPLNISKNSQPGDNAVPSIVVTTPTDVHIKNGGLKSIKNGGPNDVKGGLRGVLNQIALKTPETGLKSTTSNPSLAVHSKTSPRKQELPHTSRT